MTQNSTESKTKLKNRVRCIGTNWPNWAPRHAQVRAQWPYRGPWPGRVAATVPLTPMNSPPAARACRASCARLSRALRTPALRCVSSHPLVRSRLRPAPLRQRLLAQHARSLSLPLAQRRIVAAQPAVSQGPAPCRSAPLAVSWAGTRAKPAPSLPSSTIHHFFVLQYDLQPTAPKLFFFHDKYIYIYIYIYISLIPAV